jgi:hypothetical protein
MSMPRAVCLAIGLAMAAPSEFASAASATAERVPELTADQKRVRELAVANCESMWDLGTHMTKRDWARTCRRVQNRLQSLDVK